MLTCRTHPLFAQQSFNAQTTIAPHWSPLALEMVDGALRHTHQSSEISLGHFPDENVKVSQADLVRRIEFVVAHICLITNLLVVIARNAKKFTLLAAQPQHRGLAVHQR